MTSSAEALAIGEPGPRRFWFEDATNSGAPDLLAGPLIGVRVPYPAGAMVGAIVASPGVMFDAYLLAERVASLGLSVEGVAPEAAAELLTGGISTAKAIRKAHEDSGLTWEQLARVFCVSRRSVHSWANGARMNATNVELLMRFVGFLDRLEAASPEERRAALLAIGRDGKSALDRFRLHYSQLRNAFDTLPRPESLLGAEHDDVAE
jgi:DNA-binding transcriptional regulator YiaG